jgi:hypothetical protein
MPEHRQQQLFISGHPPLRLSRKVLVKESAHETGGRHHVAQQRSAQRKNVVAAA